MKIAICDDDELQLHLIDKMIESYIKEQQYKKIGLDLDFGSGQDELFTVELFLSPFELLDYVEKNGGFDLFLLDVLMQGMTGVDLAKELRQRRENSRIIFLTASSDFAVDAFEVGAIHYILKPITMKSLFQALNKAFEVYYRTKRYFLVRKTDLGVERINFHSINYCESHGRTVEIILNNGQKVSIAEKISDLFQEISVTKQFIMPHRSYIVNMERIKQITETEVVTLQNIKIPLARRRYKEVTEAYLQFVFEWE